jgi:hypothetical protein
MLVTETFNGESRSVWLFLLNNGLTGREEEPRPRRLFENVVEITHNKAKYHAVAWKLQQISNGAQTVNLRHLSETSVDPTA